MSSPSLTPIASRVLADAPCRIQYTAGDVDGDGIDELLVEVADHFDPIETGHHDLRAIVLDTPALSTRWESARMASRDYAGFDFSTGPNDRFLFGLDADADCRRDIVLSRDEDFTDSLPTRASVLFGPTFETETALPVGVHGAPAWGHERGGDLDGDGQADLFGIEPAGTDVLVADARSGAIRFRWTPPAGEELSRAFAGDLDTDGIADLVVESRPSGDRTGVGTTRTLHGGDFAPLWALPSTMIFRPAGDTSDLDASPGLEIEMLSGWVDARTGLLLGGVSAAGRGAAGPDGIERPFVIRGRSVLLDFETDASTYLFARARDASDGTV